MRTESISYLKQHAATLDLSEPLVITQHGRPAYVVESYESRRRRDDALALAKLMALGEKSRERGETLSSEEMRRKLRAEFGQSQGKQQSA